MTEEHADDGEETVEQIPMSAIETQKIGDLLDKLTPFVGRHLATMFNEALAIDREAVEKALIEPIETIPEMFEHESIECSWGTCIVSGKKMLTALDLINAALRSSGVVLKIERMVVNGVWYTKWFVVEQLAKVEPE